jgi:positive phototaxis protein PixI
MPSQAILLDTSPVDKRAGEVYLHIQLDEETEAALPMKAIQEVVVAPMERITPLPNMPAYVIGLLNQRSRICWSIDLPQFLQLTPLSSDRPELSLVILHQDRHMLGLAFQQIFGTIRLAAEAIQSPIGAVSPGIAPYLSGCILHPAGRIILMLAPHSLLERVYS